MLRAGGHRRMLMLHGETPSRFVSPDDHATTLLFGDAGSATALELSAGGTGHFCLHTDGSGYAGLIIRGGGFRDPHPADPRHNFLQMDGAGIFNFTLERVPPLIRSALALSGRTVDQIDAYLFHQSNRFIMKHLAKKCGLPEDRVPMTIETMGNCGGPSVAVTMTRSLAAERTRPQTLMLLGYGVGLSWGAAVVDLDPDAVLLHSDYTGDFASRCGGGLRLMCGIAGLWRPNDRPAPRPGEIEPMVAALHHRGPDGNGVHAVGRVALGHARLSIIDLAGGAQPMCNEDGVRLGHLQRRDLQLRRTARDLRRARGHRFRTALRHRGPGPSVRGARRRLRRAPERPVRDRAVGRPAPAPRAGARSRRHPAALLHAGSTVRWPSPPR